MGHSLGRSEGSARAPLSLSRRATLLPDNFRSLRGPDCRVTESRPGLVVCSSRPLLVPLGVHLTSVLAVVAVAVPLSLLIDRHMTEL